MKKVQKPPEAGSLAIIKPSPYELNSEYSYVGNTGYDDVIVGGITQKENGVYAFSFSNGSNFSLPIGSVVLLIAIITSTKEPDPFGLFDTRFIIFDPASLKTGWVWGNEIQSLVEASS